MQRNSTTERDGVIYLLDNARRQHRAQLREALYIASYPHDIFLVARAINRGATITFEKEETMVTKDGTRFDIHESRNLFYLPTVEINVDQGNRCWCSKGEHLVKLLHKSYSPKQRIGSQTVRLRKP